MRGSSINIIDARAREVPLYEWSRIDSTDPANAGLADAIMRTAEASQENQWSRNLKLRDLWMLGPLVGIFSAMFLSRLLWPGLPPWSMYILMPMVVWPFVAIQGRL